MTTLIDYCKTNQDIETEAYKIAQQHKTFTADNLHELDAMTKTLQRDKRVYGAILKSLQAQGKIEPTGRYVKSGRKMCHGRPIVEWQVVK